MLFSPVETRKSDEAAAAIESLKAAIIQAMPPAERKEFVAFMRSLPAPQPRKPASDLLGRK